jgi:low molecular weight protein-tyrosine phosphatase
MTDPRVRLLFVCLGNICRSPLAEGVFLHQAHQAGVAWAAADSAGTSAYHAGDRADPRSIEVARRHGIDLVGRSRKVVAADYEAFDLILAMDRENERNMRAECPSAHQDKIKLMLSYHPESKLSCVPDPYYGGDKGFDTVYDLLDEACRGLLAEVRQRWGEA